MSMDIYIYICIYTDDDWWRWEYNYDVDGLSNVGDGVRVVGVIPIWRGWIGMWIMLILILINMNETMMCEREIKIKIIN